MNYNSITVSETSVHISFAVYIPNFVKVKNMRQWHLYVVKIGVRCENLDLVLKFLNYIMKSEKIRYLFF